MSDLIRVVMTEVVTYERTFSVDDLTALGVHAGALLADPAEVASDPATWLLEDLLNNFSGLTEREWFAESAE